MIRFGVTLNTDGSGYWSNVAKPVKCVGMSINYIDEDGEFGELIIGFDQNSWDCNEDGLIYTDKRFLAELKATLDDTGLNTEDLSYSEQGMQGEDYVSLDIGEKFLASFKEIAPEMYTKVYAQCNG